MYRRCDAGSRLRHVLVSSALCAGVHCECVASKRWCVTNRLLSQSEFVLRLVPKMQLDPIVIFCGINTYSHLELTMPHSNGCARE
jgi:hypothetical protein